MWEQVQTEMNVSIGMSVGVHMSLWVLQEESGSDWGYDSGC